MAEISAASSSGNPMSASRLRRPSSMAASMSCTASQPMEMSVGDHEPDASTTSASNTRVLRPVVSASTACRRSTAARSPAKKARSRAATYAVWATPNATCRASSRATKRVISAVIGSGACRCSNRGKGHAERMIPLHPDAADALNEVINLAKAQNAIPRRDSSVGRVVNHVFVRRGKLLSANMLFDKPLRDICIRIGLVGADGRQTVSAYRFRHTIGTQLAEGGARIQTIMAVLGHRSANMATIYARISDPEVRRQYESALANGSRIAGPCGRSAPTRQARRRNGSLAPNQLPQDRARTRPLLAPAGRRPLRM